MEENKEKKTITISLSTGICLIIIIMLSVVILAMAYFYNFKDIKGKNQNQPENNQSTNVIPTQNVTPTEEVEAKKEELDINSETVQKLYKYICHNDFLLDKGAVYRAKKVTYNDLTDYAKLLTMYENLKENDVYEKRISSEYTELVKGANGGNPTEDFLKEHEPYKYEYLYKKETIENKIKEVFGKDATVNHQSFGIWHSTGMEYKDGIYTYKSVPGGGDLGKGSRNKIIRAEKTNDYIYIYDKYFVFRTEGDNQYSCYTTSELNNDTIKLIDKTDTFSDDEVFNITKTYKHTFAKNEDGTYYWISTEIAE